MRATQRIRKLVLNKIKPPKVKKEKPIGATKVAQKTPKEVKPVVKKIDKAPKTVNVPVKKDVKVKEVKPVAKKVTKVKTSKKAATKEAKNVKK